MTVRLLTLWDSVSKDPLWNLSLEEAILDTLHQSKHTYTFIIWFNPPSVVLGRFSKVDNEVNIEYCKSEGIRVVRRISGGGTIYHDQGCLNISLLVKRRLWAETLYQILGDLVAKTIQALGVRRADIVLRENNIFVSELKICGMAAHIRNDRSLVHTSILIESNLEKLKRSLKKLKYPVMNLSKITNASINDFVKILRKIIQEDYEVIDEMEINISEINQASIVYLEKYTNKKWNIL